jgi:hypothetical protein
VGDTMRNSQGSLAVCAVLGAALITACHSTSSGASATPSSASSAAASSPSSPAASSPSPSGAGPTGNPGGSPSSAGPSTSPGSSSQSVPGVIDCGTSLSKLEVRPTSLLLVCSDGTAGLKNLTWSHWGHNIITSTSAQSIPAPTATGTGEFFLNDCDPSCAQGHDHTYRVRVTLSVVYSSPSQVGTYFGQASLTWQGSRPPAGTKSTYLLPDPSGA